MGKPMKSGERRYEFGMLDFDGTSGVVFTNKPEVDFAFRTNPTQND